MLTGIDLRFVKELRAEIENNMADYPTRVDSVESWDRLVGERERYRTFQEVLDIIDDLQSKLEG